MKEILVYLLVLIVAYCILKPYFSLMDISNIAEELEKIRKELERINK